MKTVQVTYMTSAGFAKENQSNIQVVMNDLRTLNHHGIVYIACLNSDGRTFVHTAFFRTEEDQKILNELPSFRHFQQQLRASGPELPPVQQVQQFVASSREIFA